MQFTIGTSRVGRPIELRPVTGRSWVPVVIADDSTGWTTDTTFTLLLQIETNQEVASHQDVLIAWDCLTTNDLTPAAPSHAIPLYDSSHASDYGKESLTISSWGCGNSWTMIAVARIPDTGADINTDANGWPRFDPANPTTTGQTLCTFWESSTKYLRVILDRKPLKSGDKEIAENRLLVVDANGVFVELTGPTYDAGSGRTFRQPFLFLKGRQVLLEISRDNSAGNYMIAASVGGTQVVTVTDSTLQAVKPSTIKIGDQSNGKIDPCEIFGFWCRTSSATSASDAKTDLQTLGFWNS